MTKLVSLVLLSLLVLIACKKEEEEDNVFAYSVDRSFAFDDLFYGTPTVEVNTQASASTWDLVFLGDPGKVLTQEIQLDQNSYFVKFNLQSADFGFSTISDTTIQLGSDNYAIAFIPNTDLEATDTVRDGLIEVSISASGNLSADYTVVSSEGTIEGTYRGTGTYFR